MTTQSEAPSNLPSTFASAVRQFWKFRNPSAQPSLGIKPAGAEPVSEMLGPETNTRHDASARHLDSSLPPYLDHKMEALGRLTAGVAHEFNNLLTIILGNAEILRMSAQGREDPREERQAEAIETAAQRGGRLAAQLLAYSRKQLLRPEILSVYDVLSGLNDLLSRAAGEAVQVRLQADSALWCCRVDRGQLESAVLNIVLNARDAMPSGGTLTLFCRNQRIEPKQAAMWDARAGEYVRLDVSDTGTGIPAEIQSRVFDPFFTTKPIGSGSGLGLAQVHGFAGQSGGWAELASVVDHGTTISLLLPRAVQDTNRLVQELVVPAAPARKDPGGIPRDPRLAAEKEEIYRELLARSRAAQSPRPGWRRPERASVQHDPPAPLSVARTTTPRAVRLGVAPLKTMGSTATHVFSVGLAEEVTTALSRFRWISCISPASVAAVADAQVENPSRWSSLDLDYLLDGTFHKVDEKIRITVRLINLRDLGEISWSKRFDGDLTDILTLQSEIAADTAAQVAPEVLIWESNKAVSRPQVHPSSYELMLRAVSTIYRLDQQEFRAAGALLKEALSLDPSNAAAHSWLAHWYLLLIGQGWASNIRRSAELTYEHARRAIALDPGDARGLTVAGHVEAFLWKRPQEALQLHARAIGLNPNFALAWCYSGLANSYLGRHAEAIEHIRRAQDLSPHDPHKFFFDTSMVMPLLLTGDYENAAQVGRRARDANPSLSSAHKGLISTLGLLGRIEEARSVRIELAELEPHFSVQNAIERSPLTRPEDVRRYAEGLRLAGCEETMHPRALRGRWKTLASRGRQRARLDELAD